MMLHPEQALPYVPKKIISLVPSQTELLFYLGVKDEVIGITKFCFHPANWYKTKTKVGGTKTVNIKAIKNLNPDLIIANKEENVQSQVEELAENYPVLLTDVNSIDDALNMIKVVGNAVSKKQEATDLIHLIIKEFSSILPVKPFVNTAYLIWKDPYMASGSNTFINDILKQCGLKNVFENTTRYPEISIEQLQKTNCSLLLLSSEPYPFKQKHIDELKQLLPSANIILVDGEMFSWYGSRMLHMPQYLKKLLQHIAI